MTDDARWLRVTRQTRDDLYEDCPFATVAEQLINEWDAAQPNRWAPFTDDELEDLESVIDEAGMTTFSDGPLGTEIASEIANRKARGHWTGTE